MLKGAKVSSYDIVSVDEPQYSVYKS